MTSPNYGLMSDPYVLHMNYKDGTSSTFFDPELMDFNNALDRAHDAFSVRKATGIQPELDSIYITCHDRLAIVVFENEKHHWPDWSDPWKGYDIGGMKEFRLP